MKNIILCISSSFACAWRQAEISYLCSCYRKRTISLYLKHQTASTALLRLCARKEATAYGENGKYLPAAPSQRQRAENNEKYVIWKRRENNNINIISIFYIVDKKMRREIIIYMRSVTYPSYNNIIVKNISLRVYRSAKSFRIISCAQRAADIAAQKLCRRRKENVSHERKRSGMRI